MSPTFLSIEAAAGALDVHPRTIRRRIAEGRLKAYRVGPRQIRIRVADLDALLAPIPTAAIGGGPDAA
ncbi:MAG: helix-turn-helix domain-containing protein [Actinomycetota bacterium]|nr:helix-turn-helix domain-containing protein [Actinomycetota bacterium]